LLDLMRDPRTGEPPIRMRTNPNQFNWRGDPPYVLASSLQFRYLERSTRPSQIFIALEHSDEIWENASSAAILPCFIMADKLGRSTPKDKERGKHEV
jgi:hypothetical protein